MLFRGINRTGGWRMLVLAAAGLAVPSLAQAQSRSTPVQVPQPDKAIASQRAIAPQNADAVLPPRAGTAQSPSGDNRPLFRLREVVVEGASALSQAELGSAYAGFLGKEVSQTDLIQLAGALSDAYRAAGYHLSRAIIPVQDLKAGRLRVQVIEGSIAEIVVNGDEAGHFGVRALLEPLKAESPSRLASIERRLLLAADRAGSRITKTDLDEIGTATGRFRLTVTAQTWHRYLGASTDNMGSRAVGPWQSALAGALNSLLIPGDSLSVSGSFVPGSPHELRAGRIGYDVPLGVDSLRLGLSASRSEIRVGDLRRFDRTIAQTDTFELRASYAPLITRTQSLWLSAVLGIADTQERNAFGRISSDRFGYAGLGADYRIQMREGSTTNLSAVYRQGLGLIDGKPDSWMWLSRSGASPHFSLLNLGLAHVETPIENWSIRLAASGQLASGPLLASQQFYLGGQTFGRGFENGWLGGDSGLAGSAELRFDRKLTNSLIKGYQLFAFAEGGATVSRVRPKDVVQRLASVGGGVRVALNDNLQFGLTVARPLSTSSRSKWDRGAIVLVSLVSALQH
jgi:hemolysin activation/secretion protein